MCREIWERATLRRWAAMQNERDRGGQQVLRARYLRLLVWKDQVPRTRSNSDEMEQVEQRWTVVMR